MPSEYPLVIVVVDIDVCDDDIDDDEDDDDETSAVVAKLGGGEDDDIIDDDIVKDSIYSLRCTSPTDAAADAAFVATSPSVR